MTSSRFWKAYEKLRKKVKKNGTTHLAYSELVDEGVIEPKKREANG